MINNIKKDIQWLKNQKHDKVFIVTVSVIWICALMLMYSIIKLGFIEKSQKREVYILEQCNEISNNILKLEDTSIELECKYHDNIMLIYDRILELSNDSSDEVKKKLVKGIRLEDDPLSVEASILALLQTYPEFQEDTEVQTFLNDNIKVLKKLDQYQSMKEVLTNTVKEYYNEINSDESSSVSKNDI